MLLWSINVKISVATINLLLWQKPWEFLHFWHFYVWKSFRISCLSVCSDPFIGKAFHAAPTVFISQSLYAESIQVFLLQRTHKVFIYKSQAGLFFHLTVLPKMTNRFSFSASPNWRKNTKGLNRHIICCLFQMRQHDIDEKMISLNLQWILVPGGYLKNPIVGTLLV